MVTISSELYVFSNAWTKYGHLEKQNPFVTQECAVVSMALCLGKHDCDLFSFDELTRRCGGTAVWG